jgi:hypothetical protein
VLNKLADKSVEEAEAIHEKEEAMMDNGLVDFEKE